MRCSAHKASRAGLTTTERYGKMEQLIESGEEMNIFSNLRREITDAMTPGEILEAVDNFSFFLDLLMERVDWLSCSLFEKLEAYDDLLANGELALEETEFRDGLEEQVIEFIAECQRE